MHPRVLMENVLEQVSGAWRFRWWALLVAWVLCLLASIGIFLLPDTYQATARVFVDTRTTLSDVTRGIGVESNVDNQIQRVREMLVGGPQLLKVAEDLGLMPRATSARDQQQALQKIRERIDISGGMTNQSAGVFTITYKHHDRPTALKVVDRLLNAFVQGAIGGKRESSEQAQKFLVDQIAEYEHRLSDAEERLAQFKKTNVGLMPGTQGDYFARLQKETDSLQEAQANLAVQVQRRDQLGRQLRGEDPLLTTPVDAGRAAAAPVGAGSDTATRIRETQAKLDELLLRFTDKHPDVIALKATLADLQKRQQAEIDGARHGDPGAAARTGLTANPVYQNIQLQFNQAEVEIAADRANISDAEHRVAELKGLVNTAPEVEAELARLNRDYDVTRAQYQTLLDRLQRARLSEDADSTGIIRFEVIDPPTAGFAPVAPKRGLLLLAALIASVGAGGAVAYLLHLLKPVFSSVRQLHALTGLPVLGAVSMSWLDKHRTHARRAVMGYAAAAALLICFTAVELTLDSRITHFVQGSLYESR